jgi:IMP dehydrogenase
MNKLIDKVALTFDDVLIEPGYSDISSREEVDLSSEFIGLKLKLPIVSANMDYITEARMAHAMWEAGGVGILHRFADLENEAENQARQRDWIESLHTADTPAIISVGVRHPQQTMDWLASLDMSKIHAVCIDVAHGHMQKVLDLVEKIRATYPKNYIIAGNVATGAGYETLAKAGADVIKVGIGGGSTCLTRVVTGIGVPQLTAIMDCAEAKEKLSEKTALIADGGIRNSGDIVKALAGGADVVMIGRLLAGAEECPTTQTYTVHQSADGTRMILSGPVSSELGIKGGGTVYRQYRGQSTFGSNKDRYTKEGVSGLVEAQGPVREILRGLTEGVRSGMSYVGARTLPELRERAVFRTVFATSLAESGPRIKTSL